MREEYMLWEEKLYYERKEAAETAALKQGKEDILELLEDYGADAGRVRKGRSCG